MKVVLEVTMIIIAISTLTMPAVAEVTSSDKFSLASVDPLDAQEKALKTQALALKRLEFELFAKEKVKQLNQNHIFSRSRMEIIKQEDGTYRARYHQIDDSTMGVEVSSSQSTSIPYVGVLSYREQVLESTVSTLEQLNQNSFSVVRIIPNRHIFSYQKGAWK